MAAELESLLGDPARRKRIEERLAELPERLGGPGTLERVAHAVLETAREEKGVRNLFPPEKGS